MPRPHRVDPVGGIHHVYTRGSNRWVLFHDDHDRRRFVTSVGVVCSRYKTEVLAFCLMDNHLHLVLRCPDGLLSEAMRDLKSGYARWFKRRHRSSGPIYEARFGSRLVTSYEQLRRLVRYVHRNPYAISATMELGCYPWSSHPAYLGTSASPSWLRTEIVASMFSDYRREVERPDERDAVQNRPPFGQLSVMVPGTITLAEATPALSDILIAVAHAAGTDVANVHPAKRNGLIGVALVLAHDEAGFRQTEVAEPFGYRTVGAANMARRRTVERLNDRHDLRLILDDARRRLWPQAA